MKITLRHTAGPWQIDEDGYPREPEIRGNDGRLIARIYPISARGKPITTIVEAETTANARLVTASPKLLEVVLMVADSNGSDFARLREWAISAIREAGCTD